MNTEYCQFLTGHVVFPEAEGLMRDINKRIFQRL
jgi:hypothetical protein